MVNVLKNFSHASALQQQALLCSAGGLAAASRCAMRQAVRSDQSCQDMLRYVASLSQTCIELLMQVETCAESLLLGQFLAELNAPFLWKVPQRPAKEYNTQACTLILKRLQRSLRIVLTRQGEEGLPGSERWYKHHYNKILKRCAVIRSHEISAMIPEARSAWSAEASKAASQSGPDQQPKIGVVIAVNWEHNAEFYGQTLELWECYCRRHGDCELVLDTLEMDEDSYPVLSGVDASTGHVYFRRGKEWNRWFALDRHLREFELIFTADPDQFVSRECYGTSLSSALGAHNLSWPLDKSWNGPDIIMRDFPRYHTLNSAGVFVRQSAGARLLLRLLFDKVHWYGMPNLDQSAFDHTLLEFMDLWHRAQGIHSTHFSSSLGSASCLRHMLAIPSWSEGTFGNYAECWHDLMDSTLGAFDQGDTGSRGRRGTSIRAPLHLADPRFSDFNYVIGNRSWADRPLVYHFAGKDKHLKDEEGTTLLDSTLQNIWGGASLPPKRHPRLWARQNPSVNATHPGTLKEEPSCTAWKEVAADAGACHPGTSVEDCRGGMLMFC